MEEGLALRRSPSRRVRCGLCPWGTSCGSAPEAGVSVHRPRIGFDLAGGPWDEVGAVAQTKLVEVGVNVTVHDFAERNG